MSRHPIDHPTPPGAGRLRHFLRIAKRAQGDHAHPAVQVLARRARGASARKTRAFTLIARGARA